MFILLFRQLHLESCFKTLTLQSSQTQKEKTGLAHSTVVVIIIKTAPVHRLGFYQ